MPNSQVPALRGTQHALANPGDFVPYVPLNYNHPGLSFSQVFSILRARRWSIVLTFLLVLGLLVGITSVLPRSYEASSTLMIEFEVNDPLGAEKFPIGLLSSYVATQIELMQSPTVLLPVVERLALTQDEQLISGFAATERGGLSEWVASRILKNLSVMQGRSGSQLVHITYTGHNPQQAANIANAIADVYLERHDQRMADPAGRHAERYSAQLEGLRSKVIQAQDRMSEFRNRTGLIEPDGNVDLEMERLETLEQRLLEAQQNRRSAEVRSRETARSGSMVMSSDLIQKLKSEISQQAAHLANLQINLGSRHPDLLALKAQLATNRAALDRAVDSYSANAASSLRSARALEAKLVAAVSEQRALVVSTRGLQDQAARHQLELESTRNVYRRALDGFDQVMFTADGRYSNVALVSAATAPFKPSSPRVFKYLLLSFVLAAGASVGIPLIYEMLRRRVRCREDLERDHGIPVLMELGPLMPAEMPT